jgi:hypothetical protein
VSHDPVVAEIQRAREKIWKECGEDIDRFFDWLKAAEEKHRDRLVSRLPRQDKGAGSSP